MQELFCKCGNAVTVEWYTDWNNLFGRALGVYSKHHSNFSHGYFIECSKCGKRVQKQPRYSTIRSKKEARNWVIKEWERRKLIEKNN